METIIIDEKRKEAWDQYVQQHPGSIAWQSYGWYSVLRKHYPVTFLPLAVTNGKGIRGVLPLYRIGSSRGKNVLISVPYAVAGGILADDAEAERLLVEKAVSLAGEFGSRGITLKQYKRKVAGNFRDDDAFYNRELDISGTLLSLAGHRRRNKQQVMRRGLPLRCHIPWRHQRVLFAAAAAPSPKRRSLRQQEMDRGPHQLRPLQRCGAASGRPACCRHACEGIQGHGLVPLFLHRP
jgi:hypothetical protein